MNILRFTSLAVRPTFLVAALSSFLLHPSSFGQGSLTPPGPPGPTFKTLQQIEPRIDLQNAPASAVTTTDANYHFIIIQPGSYYLSANLGVTKTNGIQINAEGVTLDLNGFQISRASAGTGNGISIASGAHRAKIQRGSITGFGFGVSADTARGCAFRDLAVGFCTIYGLYAPDGSVLEACQAHDNSGTAGIRAGQGSSVTNCTADRNATNYGIQAGSGSSLINCSVHGHTGLYGINASFACSLLNCSAAHNTVDFGIFGDDHSTLTNCSAYASQSSAGASAGIETGVGCTITHCSAGVSSSSAATKTPLTGMGFSSGVGSTILGCTADENTGDGIHINGESLVRDCTSLNNGSLGDGAGIHANNGNNRIEGNNVTGNDRGIDIDGAGNLIVRNSASGNTTNYVFVANNVFGAIVDRSAPGSAMVNGSVAASSAGTADPWANIAY